MAKRGRQPITPNAPLPTPDELAPEDQDANLEDGIEIEQEVDVTALEEQEEIEQDQNVQVEEEVKVTNTLAGAFQVGSYVIEPKGTLVLTEEIQKDSKVMDVINHALSGGILVKE